MTTARFDALYREAWADLAPAAQRFLHWPADGKLTPGRLREARRRAEGYFVLGRAYHAWFAGYRGLLARHGGPLWRRGLDLLPCLEIIVGQGRGWRTVPAGFGFSAAEWIPVPTEFDAKGGAAAGPRPHLLYRPVTIGGRPVRLVWRRPNRGNSLRCLRFGLYRVGDRVLQAHRSALALRRLELLRP